MLERLLPVVKPHAGTGEIDRRHVLASFNSLSQRCEPLLRHVPDRTAEAAFVAGTAQNRRQLFVTGVRQRPLPLVFKNLWLSTPLFFARMALFLGLWILLTRLILRESRRRDADGLLAHTARSKKLSAVFLVAFALTFTLASFDWLMPVEPLFHSTIYAFYVLAGVLLAACGLVLVGHWG
jgi:hypothetical protein